MDFKTEYSGDSGILTLDGDLTIERADELKKALIDGLAETDRLIVDLENVGEADLTCLQLLCSAHRMSVRLNKRLMLSEKRSEAFRNLCKTAGFQRHTGCVLDTQGSCLWKGTDQECLCLQNI
ncbi:MAG: STAS domain-containing protein [Nitrospirae bacterium]|nr:STAS domain-containing protein [Nitrospirota bacterium]